jgi:hypothetical protein
MLQGFDFNLVNRSFKKFRNRAKAVNLGRYDVGQVL